MVPGEIFAAPGEIVLNEEAEAITLNVTNTGDRPIQVGSHYHFASIAPRRSGADSIFLPEQQSDLSRDNREKSRSFHIAERDWFTDSTRLSWEVWRPSDRNELFAVFEVTNDASQNESKRLCANVRPNGWRQSAPRGYRPCH
jgi:hypothetical protein